MILNKSNSKHPSPRIAIIGGGSWATALVKVLTDNSNKVRWWMRSKESVKFIKEFHRNPRYLSSVELNIRKAKIYSNLKRIIRYSDIIIVAIPSFFVKDVFDGITGKHLKNKIMVSAIKGMIPEDNLIIGEYFNKYFDTPLDKIVVISGPCHAEEVAQEKLSYLTIASQSKQNATELQRLFECRYIHATISDDIYGTEYSAVLKNIIAIAGGIARGLGYGDNFQAVLISNAIQEIHRFVDAVHPIDRDIKGSAYLGDLLVTAYSQFSRNRTFGNMIGKGYSVRSAKMEMDMVAEGYFAVKCVREVNKKYKVNMPITDMVFNVLYSDAPPLVEMQMLSEKLS